MIGKVVTGCVAILPYHTATQDRGSECRDFGFISRIVTALALVRPAIREKKKKYPRLRNSTKDTPVRLISWSKPIRDSEGRTPPLIGRGPDISVCVCAR